MNVYSVILICFTVVAVIISALLFARVKSIGKFLSGVLLSAALWAVMYAIELLQPNPQKVYGIVELEYIGITMLPTSWLVFVLKFLRRDRDINVRNIALILLMPLLTIVLVWTNEYHHLYYASWELHTESGLSIFTFDAGPWYVLFTIWFYATLSFGLYLLIRNRRKGNGLFQKQINILILASTLPWVANVLYLLGYRLNDNIDITPFAFILSTLAFSYALLRYQLLDLLPIAREQIVEALKEGVIVTDSEDRIIDLNREMVSILGRENEQLLGVTLTEAVPEMQKIRVDENEVTIMIRGVERVFSVTKSELNSKKGNIIGHVFLFKDITERKENEHKLILSREEAERAAVEKGEFLSTMSHEIRTPMNAILGFTHVLLQNDPREDQKEYLDIQKFSAENLLVLINDILDFAKIEAGKFELHETEIDLQQLLEQTLSTLKSAAIEKGRKLPLLVPDYELRRVKGDPVRINQILTNLISNAIKFTEKGQVTVTATVLESTPELLRMNFQVADTGVGIAEDRLAKLFDRFTQSSFDTSKRHGGTGLGLSITKRLLELMGSTISIKSTVGKGSTFSFDLTLLTTTAERSAPHFPANDDDVFNGKHLLIVDDNPINVLLAKQLLKKWDIKFGVASDGYEALKAVQASNYDLVLMDLHMPNMDGYEAAREIRSLEDSKYKTLPIIALSASGMAEVQEKVLAAGMTDFITKPFTPETLFEKLKIYLA